MSITYEEQATRSALWLRGFFHAPTGAGKSKGSLRLASRLFGGELRTTLLNSEQGRGRLYADRITYDLIDLAQLTASGQADFSPATWIKAIDVAEERNPGGIFVLDSVSHEWMGKNGVLQQADRFGDWKTVRPRHAEFVERLLAVEGHVIVCCRSKMKYEVSEEEVPGRAKPRQTVLALGVGPIQDSELQYEFNLVGQFEQRTHEVTFSGHVDPLVDTVHDLDNDDELDAVCAALEKWLSEGDPIVAPPTADEKEVTKLRGLLDAAGISAEDIEKGFSIARRQNRGQLHPDWVAKKIEERQTPATPAPAAAE